MKNYIEKNTSLREFERYEERDVKKSIACMLFNRCLKWIDEDDTEELKEWAAQTAEKLYQNFHGMAKSTHIHIEIECSRLMEDVWGNDKSWRKDFHNEIEWEKFFTEE